MRRLLTKSHRNASYRVLLCAVVICALAALTLPAGAHSSAVSSITVTNNSSREIRYLYLSPVNQEDWGPDHLNGASLGNGQSVTLSDVSCAGAEVKVIAEDRDGCFLSGVVSCSGNAQWTMTNDTPADCGSQ